MVNKKRVDLIKNILSHFGGSGFQKDRFYYLSKKGTGSKDVNEFISGNKISTDKIVNLFEDDSIQAIIELLREDKFSLRAFEILSKLSLKAKAYTKRMWEIYEEKHQFIHPIDFLLLIAKIEGRGSKAFNSLHTEKTYNRLYGQHLADFDRLCLDFQIEEKFLELKEDAETKGQEELVEKLNDLKIYVDERFSKSVERYDKAIEEQDLLLTKDRKEGLQRQIDITQKGLDRVQANTRIFLILLTIVFSAITGTFIGVLIHFINIMS